MKTHFYIQWLIVLAVAAAAGRASQLSAQPMPPAADRAVSASIVPGSPLADVVKMLQAGVDLGTIQSYIVNSPSPFNLDADQIIFLKDEGVPSDLINAMLDRDKLLYGSAVAPPLVPAAVAGSMPDTAPPPADASMNYFADTLTPYGSWLDLPGYGRCWRPTVVNYDPAWRPYCDSGHWVYTDYGWYWDSDYAWGAAFHYGRWFRHARFGWCWYPDTVWAPSWVTWRTDAEYCGWAPLPPFAVYRPGLGFYYRGASVGLDFDFGLGADCFMFVSPDHFCDRRPRSFCVGSSQAAQIFHQTTVVNNYNVSNRTVVNRGIPADRISRVTHRAIEPVRVASLPNAGRQGWRGEGVQRSAQPGAAVNNAGRNFPNGSSQLRHGPELRTDYNNNANASRRGNSVPMTQGSRQGGNQIEPSHSAAPQNLKGPANDYNRTTSQVQPYNESPAPGNPFQQSRQTRSFGTAASGGFQQHGSSQLKQRQFVTPVRPAADPRVESGTRNYNPPPVPPPGESRTGNNGSGRGSDQNTPNH